MNIQDLLEIDFTNKSTLIIGRAGAGKTWLANQIHQVFPRHELIHTDTYLKLYDEVGRQIYAAFEDAGHYKHTIIEGMLGYELLLEGYKRQSYLPDVVIEVVIPAGKQREVYLKERSPAKLRYLRHFEMVNQAKLNEYHRIVPEENKPLWITLNNEYTNEFKPK